MKNGKGTIRGYVLTFLKCLVILFFIALAFKYLTPYQIILISGITLIAKILFIFPISYLNYVKTKKDKIINKNYHPMVSVLVPCYNEEKTLDNAINAMLTQTYTNYEIIIVNDGSKDNTAIIADNLGKLHKRVRAFSVPNGGKANALNYGISKAKGELILCMDADSIYERHGIAYMVSSFQDRSVMACSGNVKVSNADNFIGRSQNAEYVMGFVTARAFSELECIEVIPGSAGMFRKAMVEAIGGFPNDTLVEDMDVTVCLQEQFANQGYKIVYNNNVVSYSEVPETLVGFYKQRYRWMYGWQQVWKKHNKTILNSKYKSTGLIGLPCFVIFPLINVSMMFIGTMAIALAIIEHGVTSYFISFGIGILLMIVLAIYAVHIDGHGEKKITISIWSVVYQMWYMYFCNYIYIKSWWDFSVGKESSWNSVARLGKNVLPTG